MEEIEHRENSPSNQFNESTGLSYRKKDRKLLTTITLVVSIIFWVFIFLGFTGRLPEMGAGGIMWFFFYFVFLIAMLISLSSTKAPVSDDLNLHPKKIKFYSATKKVAQMSTVILVLSIYPGLALSEIAPIPLGIVTIVSFILTFVGWIVYATR